MMTMSEFAAHLSVVVMLLGTVIILVALVGLIRFPTSTAAPTH